jgi:hypothetical protein
LVWFDKCFATMGDLAMNKKFGALKAFIAAVAALTCGFAYAADLPLAPQQYAAPMVAPIPVYNWTGLYAGFNGGYGFGQSTPMSLCLRHIFGVRL